MSQKLEGGGPPRFQKLQFRAKNIIFLPTTTLEGVQKPPTEATEGKWWLLSTCGLTSPCQTALEGPLTPQYVREAPPNGPQKPQNLCTMAAVNFKSRTRHMLGSVAQNAIWSAPSPPASTHFLWFPPTPSPPTTTRVWLFPSRKLPKHTPRPLYVDPSGYGNLHEPPFL